MLLVLGAPFQLLTLVGARARPDHPISGPRSAPVPKVILSPSNVLVCPAVRRPEVDMKRREFIMLIGGTAVTWRRSYPVIRKGFSAMTPYRTCAWSISLALLFISVPAHALEPDAQRGLTFVAANCTQCHAVDKVSPSPLGIAPPFRTLHTKYPVENLAEALAEGMTGHPTMPQFKLDPGQIGDVIAYLKTLEQ